MLVCMYTLDYYVVPLRGVVPHLWLTLLHLQVILNPFTPGLIMMVRLYVCVCVFACVCVCLWLCFSVVPIITF